jgi:molecular chaperone IbpA
MTKLTWNIPELHKSFIGIDRMLQHAETRLGQLASYPPHNVIKLDDNRYRVEFAVAGFKRDELMIEHKDNMLIVTGTKPEQPDVEYVYQGLAKRNFAKRVALTDYMEVESAELEDGMLVVVLEEVLPKHMKPKQIKIN